MVRSTRLLALAAVAIAGALALPALAEDAASFFPLQIGRVWTYHLTITTGEDTRHIEYTTRVARSEALPEAGGVTAFALENVSGERGVLETNWFVVDGDGRLVQPRRQSGRATSTLCARQGDTIGAPGRIMLDPAGLAALPKETTWEWASKDGSLRGLVRLVGRPKLRLRNFPEFDCVQLVDTMTSTAGARSATIERKVWLAAGYGLVQEQTTIVAGDARTESEATLIRYETP